MENSDVFPIYIIVIDYILGSIMWTLIARCIFDFIGRDNQMVLFRVFRQITDPFIKIFSFITPKFLIDFLIPAYVAWWFYLVRFYVIPFIFLGQMGMLSFPMESGITRLIVNLL